MIADLASHVLDSVEHLAGPLESVMAATHIAYPERPSLSDPTKMVPVDAEDSVTILARLPSGEGMKTFHGPRTDLVVHRLLDHPITRGYPARWKTPEVELYQFARGPAKNLTVLSFGIDEETGLTGASNLDGGLLTGPRLLNLDSEEEGALYVGCAGGADSTLTLPLDMGPAPAAAAALDVTLHGLKGGHSGIDIMLQRGNAVQLLARMLYAVARHVPLQLGRIQGGNKHNAIPREASASVIVAEPQLSQARDLFAAEFEAVSTEFAHAEPHMGFKATDAVVPQTLWTTEASVRALRLLIGLPRCRRSSSFVRGSGNGLRQCSQDTNG